jgi:endoglucanase
MRLIRRLMLLSVLVVASLAAPAVASAAVLDLTGFRLVSPLLFVNENAGSAVITIDRTDTLMEAQIRYIALPITAEKYIDFEPVKGMINFLPGQSSATFSIPIIDHGLPGLPKTVNVSLFGPSPIGLGIPSTAVLTIVNNDPLPTITKTPTNPLGLGTAPPPTDPLTGARAFSDPGSLAAEAAIHHPAWSRLLGVIARQPNVMRYGNWSGTDPGIQVSQYLARASVLEPGTVPEISTYYVVDQKLTAPHCGHYSDPPWRQAAYHRWIESLASGIGDYRVIVFLEMDSLITVGCLSHHGLAVRLHELHDAINILSQLPRAVIYLDAGAADAVPAKKTASMLRRAGVSEIQGFFVNSTHFDWTSASIKYGERISHLTGGKHFVVNTAENGRGPLIPRDRAQQGNEILCNPPGRGLGPLPTFNTGYSRVDAFAWIAYPGRSGGTCRPGSPATGVFWPQWAMQLVRHADFAVR